jgi:hypothetical protein
MTLTFIKPSTNHKFENMDQERPTITIKLKPHLQEYLRCKMADDATLRNFVGVLMRPFLEIRPNGIAPDFSDTPDRMTFNLPCFDDLNTRNGNVWMSEDNQRNFERILEAHFRELFYSYLDDKVRYLRKEHTPKGAIKKSILQFCSDNNLSFNRTTYDMLQKSYYRRTRGHTKKPPFFSSKLSSICPLLFLI